MLSSRTTNVLADFVIANAATDSNIVICEMYCDDAEALGITAPATLPETVNINVSVDGGTTYGKLSKDGASAVALAAGTTTWLTGPIGPATHIKLTAGSAVAASRTFKFAKVART